MQLFWNLKDLLHMLTAEQLIAFERDIAAEFETGHIHAPVHLNSDTQAAPLIEIFKEINPTDWVCSTWRSTFHALLKGIPPEEVKRQILAGRSMFISSPQHRFISSAIMGAMLPIACGLAFEKARVWCFLGDMAASIGAFHDAVKFADGYRLDVRFVIEDNGLSTNTPTREAWAHGIFNKFTIARYKYQRTCNHYQPLPGQTGF